MGKERNIKGSENEEPRKGTPIERDIVQAILNLKYSTNSNDYLNLADELKKLGENIRQPRTSKREHQNFIAEILEANKKPSNAPSRMHTDVSPMHNR